MTARIAAVLPLLLSLLLAPFAVRADPVSQAERQWLEANPDKLVLWYDENYPPMEFLSNDGTFVGIGADVMALVEEKLGVKFLKHASRDWPRHLTSLETGESAIAPVIVSTADRERYAFFSEPYINIPAVIITSRENGTLNSLEKLTGRRVAVVQGFVSEGYLRIEFGKNADIVTVRDVTQGLRDVSLGVVDAMVENLAVAAYHIDKEKLPNLMVAGSTPLVYSQGFAVSRQYPLLFSAMQKAMADIPPERIKGIEKKWIALQEQGLSPQTQLMLRFGAVFVVASLATLGCMSWVLRRQLKENRARLENALAELEEKAKRLNLAFDAASDGLWDWDLQSDIFFFSPRAYTMLGYEPGEFDGSLAVWSGMIHPEDLETVRSAIDESLQFFKPYEADFRMRSKTGEWLWIYSRGRVVNRDANGKPLRVAGTLVDITERKKTERDLAQSERRFRSIFESAPYPIAINRACDGAFLDMNQALLRNMELTREEAQRLDLSSASPLYGADARSLRHRIVADGGIFNQEATITGRDGREFYVIYSSVPIVFGGEEAILSITVDVTGRRRAEEDLRQSEEKFSRLFLLSPDAIILSHLETVRVRDVNRAFEGLFGLAREEAIGKTASELGILWDAPPWHMLLAPEVLAGRVADADMHFRGRDGAQLVCSVSGSVIFLDGDRYLMSVLRDVTETRKMQAMMIQTEKMLSVGGIAAGIAHEINNPLGIILNTTQNIMQRTRPDFPKNIEVARDVGLDLALMDAYMRARGVNVFIEDIRAAAIRAAGIIRHMLDFSRTSESCRATCDLTVIIDRAVELAGSDYDMKKNYDFRRIRLVREYESGLPAISCTETEIEQVMLNLLRNSGQAMSMAEPPVPNPCICIRVRTVDQGQRIRIEVEDNGPGIPEAVQHRVFEPFFTTKAKGVGTGLGLSVSNFIITEGHKGTMRVESTPGVGTKFVIELPVDASGGNGEAVQ
ncbi:PAS domain S-box protein [Desulfomicrobium escambiense]|uniref:PAS domain S-box protein n=1 Tax=Desulfomicrobium escambiense TaxID=29503 RepID=UPI0006872B2A|nr:PAS domain S-box protein [Desulfomicrobium escambiense]